MERSIRARLAWAAAPLALAAGFVGPSASAQGPSAVPAGVPASTADLMIALGRTRDQGIPTVVVVTSTARPQSGAFLKALTDCPWSRSTRGLVQVVELPAEQNPTLAQEFRLSSIPAVVAYTPGASGPVFRGQRPCENADEAVAWLVSLGLPDGRSPGVGGDGGIVRANYNGGYPSSQQPQAPPPAYAPPAQAPPPPAYAPPAMTYAPPAAPPASFVPAMPVPQPVQAPSAFVNVPGPNVFVQQGQPNVFLSQAPPAAPAAPMGNFFLPSAAPAPMAAMAQPMMAMPAMAAPAAVPMMAMPAMALAPAVAPQPALAVSAPAAPQPAFALNSQSVTVPTTRSRTTVRVRGPGMINSALARFGEKLVQRGRTTIESTQSTELGTPLAQSPGGLATLTTTGPAPVATPTLAPPSFAPPAAPPAAPPSTPPVCEPPPSPPVPPPQASPQSHGRAPGKHNHD